MDESRSKFEKFISGKPHFRCIDRYGDDAAWAGEYVDAAVQLAWEAWLKASFDQQVKKR